MKTYSTHEFAIINPEAFEALPEVYKSDDCLKFCQNIEFYEGKPNVWYCRPATGEKTILGDWNWMAVFRNGSWFSFSNNYI